jgi:glycosyltransferase involved in cell wall biosynthesis
MDKIPEKLRDKVIISKAIKPLRRKSSNTLVLFFKTLKTIIDLNLFLIITILKEKIRVVYGNNIQLSAEIIPTVIIMRILSPRINFYWHDHNSSFPNLVNASLVERMCNQVFHKTIVPNFSLQKKFNQKNKVFVLPNGIDTNLFKFNKNYRKLIREELHIDEKCVLLGIFGEISKLKGQIELLNALKKNLLLFKNQHLLILGSLNIDNKQFVIEFNKVRSEIADDFVTTLSWRDEIYKYYSAIDILVNSSVPKFGGEAFGMTIIEAMSCERIVIAADNGNTARIIEEGVSGYTYNPNDSGILQEKLVEIISKIESLDKVRINAREKIVAEFDVKKISDKFENIFI